MTITPTSLDAALKEIYDRETIQNVTHDEKMRPFLTNVKKDETFEGDLLPVPIFWSDMGGRSASFTVAQGTLEATEIDQFQIDVAENHGVARITSKAMKKARSNRGAFLKGVEHMIDAKLNQVANDVEGNLFRSRSGSLGAISTTTPTTTITLANAEDIVNFGKNQHLVFADSTTDALRDTGTSAKVATVNRIAGSFTIDALPTGTVASDLIFNKGDYTAAGSSTLKIAGLEDWIPSAAASSTTFFNVDRSQDTRLQGLFTTGATSDIEGSIYEAAALMGRVGKAVPDCAFMSFDNFRKLNLQMGGKAERPAGGGTAQGGYQTITVYGPKGLIQCKAAAFCQTSIVWLLTMDTWCLTSMGPCVDIFEEDGMRVQRISNAAGVEVRVESFAQLYTNVPAANCRVTLS